MMDNLLGWEPNEINDNMARFPKGCPILKRPIYLELKDFKENRWKRPNRIKPGRITIANMFACKTRANKTCKTMKKKLNVKDCRVKSYKV